MMCSIGVRPGEGAGLAWTLPNRNALYRPGLRRGNPSGETIGATPSALQQGHSGQTVFKSGLQRGGTKLVLVCPAHRWTVQGRQWRKVASTLHGRGPEPRALPVTTKAPTEGCNSFPAQVGSAATTADTLVRNQSAGMIRSARRQSWINAAKSPESARVGPGEIARGKDRSGACAARRATQLSWSQRQNSPRLLG